MSPATASPRTTAARLAAVARLGAVAVVAIGVAVLAGWVFDVSRLRGPVPGLVDMKANTAVGFLLCGAALLLDPSAATPRRRTLARACAGLAGLLGALTLAEYVTGARLGIDELLVHDVADPAHAAYPGRPAPQTALAFVLVAVAISARGATGRRSRRAADLTAAGVALIALFGLLGYAYDDSVLSTVGASTPIALHTAVAFVLLALAAAAGVRGGALSSLLLSDTVGAAMARRLVPIALVGLPLLGAAHIQGERLGLYGAATGTAVLVLGFLLVFVAGVAGAARALNRAERQDRAAAAIRERMAAIVDASSDAIIATGCDGRIVSWNTGAQRIFGHRREEAIGRPISLLAPGERSTDPRGILDRVLRGEDVGPIEATRLHKDGHEIVVSLSAAPLRDASGAITGASGILRDVTVAKRAQEEVSLARAVAHQAQHDALTGLPNRGLLLQRLTEALDAERGDGLAVLFVDLDAFKRLNDTLGHHGGDSVLIEVTRRLAGVLRPTDTLSRLGGDEFTILCREAGDRDGACRIAERIRIALGAPMDVAGREIVLAASVGIAVPVPGEPADVILRRADAAMYVAKRRGGARHHVYTDAVGLVPAEVLDVERDLRHALPDQLELAYQPQVQLGDGAVVAVEALLRWRHPERGLIAPGDFIPVAEESALIIPIGAWVLNEALDQLCRFDDEAGGAGRVVDMAVNVSPRQLRDPGFVETVRSALLRTGVAAHRLQLEITETVLLEDTRENLAALQDLRELGVRLVLDDFGTGYSSLGYLKRFPVDVVKIDRSFVAGLPHRRDDVAIVTAVLAFAEALALDVVAEGIETDEQRRALRRLGCAYAQGFFFNRPLPAAEISTLLAAPRTAGVPAPA
jgi:diguanylate cyclase (GGDEF)-like protein/PAS domain S-box-containing protein